MGDFALLKELPQQFQHCKATEDSDLNIFEFLTEHVSPIGLLLEGNEHEAEDEGDVPHQPVQSTTAGQLMAFVITQFSFTISVHQPEAVQHHFTFENNFTSIYSSQLFRPPIVT
jgi:hypothetical protein